MTQLTEFVLQSAEERGPSKTTCPSEIARKLFPNNWRAHMAEVRNAAISLQQQGKVKLMQKGKEIGPNLIKGPIRIQINDC